MSSTNILKNIKTSNMNKMKEITKLLDIKKEYKIYFFQSGNTKMIGFNDSKTKDKLLAGEYMFYGIYQPATKLWIWASSIPGVNKNVIKHIQKIKSFDYMFESSDDKIANFYYQLLTQDVVYISNKEMLQYIDELLLYLSNGIYYFNPSNSDGNIQFIILKNIKEKYI
jgi:hypothetical protein